jgi:hypothetical protein
LSHHLLLVAQLALGVIIGGLALFMLAAAAYTFVLSPLRWAWPLFLTLGLAATSIVAAVVAYHAMQPV